MSVPAHLSLVTLGVSDLERATSFYEALGWQRSNASADGISFFRLGGVMLGLFGAEDLAADARQSPRVGGFRGVALAINVLSIEAVDRMFQDFVRAGATAVKPPETTEWGGYSGYVADPEGHLWELAFNPYSPEWAAPGSE